MRQSEAVVWSVSEQVSVAGQLSPVQIERLLLQGFQAAMNLRPYEEAGASAEDGQRVTAVGLTYIHLPVNPSALTLNVIEQVVQRIHDSPKPLLVYCRSAFRATFMTLMYGMIYHDHTLEYAKAKGRSLGFDFDNNPTFNRWMEDCASSAMASQSSTRETVTEEEAPPLLSP